DLLGRALSGPVPSGIDRRAQHAGSSRGALRGVARMRVARISAALLVVAATAYALRQWVWLPLRCVHAAAVADVERSDTSRIRADLQGCECVSPPMVAIP